jgi:hypothetical protein
VNDRAHARGLLYGGERRNEVRNVERFAVLLHAPAHSSAKDPSGEIVPRAVTSTRSLRLYTHCRDDVIARTFDRGDPSLDSVVTISSRVDLAHHLLQSKKTPQETR